GGDLHEVALRIDADTGPPDARDTAERVTPLRAVGIGVQRGIQLAVPDDRSQALPGPRDAGAGGRAAAPIHDIHATIGIPDECRVPVLQRLVREAVVRRPVVAVDVGEPAIEGREQTRALAFGNHRRSAYGRVR